MPWVAPLWVHPPSLRSIRLAICREFHKNFTTNQRKTNSRNTVEHQSSLKSSLMTSPTKFEVILISYSSTMHGNCSTNQRPGNGENSAGCDYPPHPNGFIHQVLGQSSKRFIRKCAETSKVWQLKLCSDKAKWYGIWNLMFLFGNSLIWHSFQSHNYTRTDIIQMQT